jgi:hypothetical protein
MIKTSLLSLNKPSNEVRQDAFQRLSLAVHELDKLINRANQLSHFSEQPFPPDQSTQPDQATLSQKP